MGKGDATIREGSHTRSGRTARELAEERYPDGLPRGTTFSALEAITGAPGDEMARRLIAINVQEQADDWPEEEPGECEGVIGRRPAGEPDDPAPAFCALYADRRFRLQREIRAGSHRPHRRAS